MDPLITTKRNLCCSCVVPLRHFRTQKSTPLFRLPYVGPPQIWLGILFLKRAPCKIVKSHRVFGAVEISCSNESSPRMIVVISARRETGIARTLNWPACRSAKNDGPSPARVGPRSSICHNRSIPSCVRCALLLRVTRYIYLSERGLAGGDPRCTRRPTAHPSRQTPEPLF